MPLGVFEPVGLGADEDDARVEVDDARVEEGLGEKDAGAPEGARDDCATDDETSEVVEGTTSGVEDAGRLLDGATEEVGLLLEEGTTADTGLAEEEVPDVVHLPNNGLQPVPQ
jgi:hypothetical protein